MKKKMKRKLHYTHRMFFEEIEQQRLDFNRENHEEDYQPANDWFDEMLGVVINGRKLIKSDSTESGYTSILLSEIKSKKRRS